MMKLNHGDFRELVTHDMYQMVRKIVDAKSDRVRPYYILVNVKPYYQGPPAVSYIKDGQAFQNPTVERRVGGQVCHARITILEPAERPRTPQLGTILWKIDNRKGMVKLVYALPVDIPNPVEDSDNAGDVAVVAAESARKIGLPLIWN